MGRFPKIPHPLHDHYRYGLSHGLSPCSQDTYCVCCLFVQRSRLVLHNVRPSLDEKPCGFLELWSRSGLGKSNLAGIRLLIYLFALPPEGAYSDPFATFQILGQPSFGHDRQVTLTSPFLHHSPPLRFNNHCNMTFESLGPTHSRLVRREALHHTLISTTRSPPFQFPHLRFSR